MVEFMKGVIERRILVNYRIDPSVLASTLPSPFEPELVKGFAMGGLCLIRFRKMRPKGMPKCLGTSSENGTHRFCVTWRDGADHKSGIYVHRRFTSSLLHAFGSDIIFPGQLKHADFDVAESDDAYRVSFRTKAGASADVHARKSQNFPSGSVFEDLQEASEHFQKGRLGYSPDKDGKGFAGVRLNTTNWKVSPLDILHCNSTLFSDEAVFPAGSVELDHALLMEDIHHNWQDVDRICCD